MAHEKKRKTELAERVAPIVEDVERLAHLHADLLRSELRQSVNTALPALTGVGVGAGLVVAGGVLGLLAGVHGFQRLTRLPLWACYGLASGTLAGAGVALMRSGAHRVSEVSFIPHQTIATLQEDYQWLRGSTT